jgi:phage-related protein
MGLLNHLTYDGVDSSSFGVFISGDGVFDAPARRGEMISIPGRNGSLFMDEGVFENIEVEYPAFIGTGYEALFRQKLGDLRSWLSSRGNYKRLTDTYHPDEFRLGVYREGLEVDPQHITRAGEFTLKFDCKPQRFLLSGENSVVFIENGTIINPTLFASSPLIKVRGNGTVSFGNNGEYRFVVSDNTGTIWIDTDIMEAYLPAGEVYPWTDENGDQLDQELGIGLELLDGTQYPTNMLGHIEFVNSIMPKIDPGEQPVRMSPTILELEIIPRWWRL